MVNDYFISKFDKDFIFYQVLFNGTVQNFIKDYEDKDYKFNTQNKSMDIKMIIRNQKLFELNFMSKILKNLKTFMFQK